MEGHVTIDATDFMRSLRRYAEVRKIDNATACNRQARQIALRAFWDTQRADAPRIESQLGADVAHEIVWTKSGKISKSAKNRSQGLVANQSLAYNIAAARIKRSGKPMPTTREIQAIAAKMVHKRIAAVGYIARGWLNAIKKLTAPDSQASVPPGRPSPGTARLATPSTNVFAEIVNLADNPHSPSGARALAEVGEKGLARAVSDTVADMDKYVTKQLTDAAREFQT